MEASAGKGRVVVRVPCNKQSGDLQFQDGEMLTAVASTLDMKLAANPWGSMICCLD